MTHGYAYPETLVSTDWVAQHLGDPTVRIVESDEDVLRYETGHIRGAVKIDWHTDEQDQVKRDFIDKAGFERLMSSRGIANTTTVVFYGDKNNGYACYTFWLFKLYGHRDCRIMNGGYAKWEAEGREMTRDVPSYPQTSYTAKEADLSIRAFRDDVLREYVDARDGRVLVDVRSPQEYRGELLAMVGYAQEGAQRAGHIPSARSIPWAKAINADGTFKSAEELQALYEGEGVTPDKRVVVYCRIGKRSSHTWFVLTRVLGYEHVKNYDGSWTEWGSLVGVPIAQGDEPAMDRVQPDEAIRRAEANGHRLGAWRETFRASEGRQPLVSARCVWCSAAVTAYGDECGPALSLALDRLCAPVAQPGCLRNWRALLASLYNVLTRLMERGVERRSELELRGDCGEAVIHVTSPLLHAAVRGEGPLRRDVVETYVQLEPERLRRAVVAAYHQAGYASTVNAAHPDAPVYQVAGLRAVAHALHAAGSTGDSAS
jgi:thiosulfate/3-mercaptopyruvate sulfurtransferase